MPKSILKGAIKNLFLIVMGGFLYCLIEIAFRGYTYWSMGVVGGLSFFICGLVNEHFSMDMPIVKQMAICSIAITMIEFITGCILNIWMGLDIWDYSNIPMNICGQICLPFSLAWFALSLQAIVLDDYLRYRYFGEEKPYYRWK